MEHPHSHKVGGDGKQKHHEVLQHVISSQWSCNILCFYQYVVYMQLDWQRVSYWSSGRRGFDRRAEKPSRRMAFSWDDGGQNVSQICCTAHEFGIWDWAPSLQSGHVEHQGHSMSSEFKFGFSTDPRLHACVQMCTKVGIRFKCWCTIQKIQESAFEHWRIPFPFPWSHCFYLVCIKRNNCYDGINDKGNHCRHGCQKSQLEKG